MVKNKKGGKSHRKMASKKDASASYQTRIRMAVDEDETYAKVLKVLGGRRAEVICNDGKTRILEIRKKFGGRNKRDNMIAQDTMILVGMRSWERRQEGKKEKVDLLYVYSSGQLDALKKDSKINYDILPGSSGVDDSSETGFDITNTETWEDKLREEGVGENSVTSVKQTITLNIGNNSGTNELGFDFDDI
jgi:initiation factor 1A